MGTGIVISKTIGPRKTLRYPNIYDREFEIYWYIKDYKERHW